MPSLSSVGVGAYIKNPRGRRAEGSGQLACEVLYVSRDDGNTFLCYPVTSTKVGANGKEAVLDTARYQQIPPHQQVEQVTI